MVDCKICGHPYCEHAGTQRGIVIDCANYMPRPKPQTNADRIRSMSDKELAEFLQKADFYCKRDCEKCLRGTACIPMLQWLQQPVKDGE